MKTYKVFCEFYIKAKDKSEAEEIVIDDMVNNNFFEEHIILDESKKPKNEGIWKNP